MQLELQQRQKQVISGRMIQSAEILQMSSWELKEYINEIMMENPVIDLEEPDSDKESFEEKYVRSYSEEYYGSNTYQKTEQEETNLKNSWNIDTDEGNTLQEFLWSQLVQEEYSKKEIQVIKFMIQSLDSKGYMTENAEDISKIFHMDFLAVLALLKKIQSLDPAGIGAMNLQECLKLQFLRKKELTPIIENIIDNHLQLIGDNKIPVLAKEIGLSVRETADICKKIKQMNPKPGIHFSNRQQLKYIIPDVVIVKFRDYFDIILNENLYSTVSVNSYYSNMKNKEQSKEVLDYLDQKIKQACWIKQSIEQRNETLLKISKSIIQYQEEFFEKGISYLKPYKMSEAAKEIGIHESTVSRAVRKKYLQCCWGIFPMNYFFSRGGMKDKNRSSEEIKSILFKLIEEENKNNPRSDSTLAKLLQEKGIYISRRTIAKYREQEKIPGASGRKEYF